MLFLTAIAHAGMSLRGMHLQYAPRYNGATRVSPAAIQFENLVGDLSGSREACSSTSSRVMAMLVSSQIVAKPALPHRAGPHISTEGGALSFSSIPFIVALP